MSSPPAPDPEEVIVHAKYILFVDHDQDTLRKLKRFFSEYLESRGYAHTDLDLGIWGPTTYTMTFEKILSDPEPPLGWRLKEKLGMATRESYLKDAHLEELARTRPDIPYSFQFRIVPKIVEESEAYEIHVQSTPNVTQQYRQGVLNRIGEYDLNNVVHTNKQEIKHLMGRMGIEAIRRPYTEAELLEPTLRETHRDELEESRYGTTAIQYIDEADKCFQRDYFHASLNCYVLGIEWVIISYFDLKVNRDIIEEEQDMQTGYYFGGLVEELEKEGVTSQVTIEKLDEIGDTERHWMAHHKFGEIPQDEIRPIKRRLGVLLDEIFT